jgi:hypothetical protein
MLPQVLHFTLTIVSQSIATMTWSSMSVHLVQYEAMFSPAEYFRIIQDLLLTLVFLPQSSMKQPKGE